MQLTDDAERLDLIKVLSKKQSKQEVCVNKVNIL